MHLQSRIRDQYLALHRCPLGPRHAGFQCLLGHLWSQRDLHLPWYPVAVSLLRAHPLAKSHPCLVMRPRYNPRRCTTLFLLRLIARSPLSHILLFPLHLIALFLLCLTEQCLLCLIVQSLQCLIVQSLQCTIQPLPCTITNSLSLRIIIAKCRPWNVKYHRCSCKSAKTLLHRHLHLPIGSPSIAVPHTPLNLLSIINTISALTLLSHLNHLDPHSLLCTSSSATCVLRSHQRMLRTLHVLPNH